MTTKVPLIGFDRFVDFEWCLYALDAAASNSPIEVIKDRVAMTLSGAESQRKTMDVLKRLSTKPFEHLSDFMVRGVAIYKKHGSSIGLPLIWGASIASYPFFGKTAETTGRLLSIQGDCTVKELQRRIAEQYGDRSGIGRAVTRVLQSQVSWQALTRDETAKRVKKPSPFPIEDDELSVWLVEAAIRYLGKPIAVAHLHSLAVLFPFTLHGPLAYLASTSLNLELRSDGPSNQVVALRSLTLNPRDISI